jgi:hypothetical protein
MMAKVNYEQVLTIQVYYVQFALYSITLPSFEQKFILFTTEK